MNCKETVTIDGVVFMQQDVPGAAPAEYQFTAQQEGIGYVLQYRGITKAVFKESVMTVTIERIH